VYVSIGEGTLADHLNAVLAAHPDLMLGSYPEFANPEYKVKVTLESKDRAYLDLAVGNLLDRLPKEAVVRVER
jgi:molybdopterin-biosynthesis enzyme MoeA-like protein